MRMGTVTDIRIAKRTGFCYGVREAIDKAKEASAAGKATHTLGQVVHNEGVVRDLQALGIRTVDTLDDVDHGAAVVIRAHGVRPEVMDRASERGLEVIDGTCTWVIQEQRELSRLVEEGYTIVLLGTPKHPEVVGLLGFAPDAIVVDEEEDWGKIPSKKRMALISQSTQPPWKFEKLAAFMVGRSHELKIVNTVCPVTIRRQQDTLESASEVDPDGGGRRSIIGEHEGTHPPVRHRGDPRPPDRVGPGPRRSDALRGSQGRWRDRRHVDPDRGSARRCEAILEIGGTAETQARAAELADAAFLVAAHPAGRTTSLPVTASAG